MKIQLTYETTDAETLAIGMLAGGYKPATREEIRTYMSTAVEAALTEVMNEFYDGRRAMAAAAATDDDS